MKHKDKLSPQKKIQILNLLKKQRDGVIIGTYRNILFDTYNKIQSFGNKENTIISLDEIFLNNLIYGEHEKNLFYDYCMDLEQLGYINICESGHVQIIKDLDF